MTIKPNTNYWVDINGQRMIVKTDNFVSRFVMLGHETVFTFNDDVIIICEVATPEFLVETLQQKSRDNEAINRSRMEHIAANHRANQIIGQQADELFLFSRNPESNQELLSLQNSRLFWQDCMRAALRDKDLQIRQLQEELTAKKIDEPKKLSDT
jgi:hypothetical protein